MQTLQPTPLSKLLVYGLLDSDNTKIIADKDGHPHIRIATNDNRLLQLLRETLRPRGVNGQMVGNAWHITDPEEVKAVLRIINNHTISKHRQAFLLLHRMDRQASL